MNILNEGGVSSHLNHPYDVRDFNFLDLKDITDNSLSGKLDTANEKIDGSNLAISFKNGKLVIGRNATSVKNDGELAPDVEQFKKDYPDRESWIKASEDLEVAIKSLSKEEKDKYFGNGKKWLTMEVLHPDFENVIPYKVNQLIFHGTREVNLDGSTKLENKQDAIDLIKILEAKKALQGKTYSIHGPKYLKMSEVPDFKAQQKKFSDKLSEIKKSFGATDSTTIDDILKKKFEVEVKKIGLKDKSLNNTLISRFKDSDKSISLAEIKKQVTPEQYLKIKELDENSGKIVKGVTTPFEKYFIALGATVLENISDLIGMSGDVTAKKKDMVDRINKIVEEAKKSNNPKILAKIQFEFERIQEAGGLDKIIPSEGIVFYHKGHLLKLTGAFAPANQLYGLRFKDLSVKEEPKKEVATKKTDTNKSYYKNLSDKALEKSRDIRKEDPVKSKWYASWSKYWDKMASGNETKKPDGVAPKIRGTK